MSAYASIFRARLLEYCVGSTLCLRGEYPPEHHVFEPTVLGFLELDVGYAELFVRDVATKHALEHVAAVFYKIAVDDFL